MRIAESAMSTTFAAIARRQPVYAAAVQAVLVSALGVPRRSLELAQLL
jgi:hypothetical protein